jgi:hypothetical protein
MRPPGAAGARPASEKLRRRREPQAQARTMSFRQHKSSAHVTGKAWIEWIERVRPSLQAIGPPPEVSLGPDHWNDFLENGHLHWHPQDSTGFEFMQLSAAQSRELLRFLEEEFPEADRHPPLLKWLRLLIRD